MFAKTTNATLRKQLLIELADTESNLRAMISGLERVIEQDPADPYEVMPIVLSLREIHAVISMVKRAFCNNVPQQLPELDRKGALINDEDRTESVEFREAGSLREALRPIDDKADSAGVSDRLETPDRAFDEDPDA